ncbi:MAG: segregation/condensation protein A [Eubacteriales bacterium]|nr:segregation/condensation protein A [Eubacteriales bacterium]
MLLVLINKHKIDIYNIPIVLIFEQYMLYVDKMQETDMDITVEFISMAAELMLIKSKMLLPKPIEETEEDPRKNLVATLEEHKRMKERAAAMAENYAIYGGRLSKESETFDEIIVLESHNANLLHTAFGRIMRRNNEYNEYNESIIKPEKTIGNLLSYRSISITGRIYGIMRYLYKNGDTSFNFLIFKSVSRSDVIATFVALLELLNSRRIIISDVTENTGEYDRQDYILRLNKEHNPK